MEEGREILGREPQPTKNEVAPKKEIGDEELGNLISAFGNHGVKALIFAAMRPGIIYTRRAREGTTLAQELWEHLQGKTTAWRIKSNNLFGYCEDSLSHPLTLVTREVVDSDLGIYGYMITPYGIETGQALAGHLLDWSLKYDKSLIEALGSTASAGGRSKEIEVGGKTVEFKKRAPITRLKIFRQILASHSLPIRLVDFMDALREDRVIIKRHIINLGRFGIIDRRARKADQSYTSYQLAEQRPDKEPEPHRVAHGPYPTLTRQVYNLFVADPNLKASPTEAYQRLIKTYPAYQDRKQSSLEKLIYSILSHLQGQGYLKNEEFRRSIQSEINLTDRQRKMLSDLLQIIDRFQSGDRKFWQEGRVKTQDILADPQNLAKLMNKARQTSPFPARTSQEDMENNLVILLSEYPNSSVRQLQEYLEKEYGKKLDEATISVLLRKSGNFVPHERHQAVYWTVKTD